MRWVHLKQQTRHYKNKILCILKPIQHNPHNTIKLKTEYKYVLFGLRRNRESYSGINIQCVLNSFKWNLVIKNIHFYEHTLKIVSKRRNSPVILCIYNGMLTTGIHRKVSIPGHSYVRNEMAHKIVQLYLKEKHNERIHNVWTKWDYFKTKTVKCKMMKWG